MFVCAVYINPCTSLWRPEVKLGIFYLFPHYFTYAHSHILRTHEYTYTLTGHMVLIFKGEENLEGQFTWCINTRYNMLKRVLSVSVETVLVTQLEVLFGCSYTSVIDVCLQYTAQLETVA